MFSAFLPQIKDALYQSSDKSSAQIAMDIPRCFFLGDAKEHALFKQLWANTVDDTYTQGNHSGQIFQVLFNEQMGPGKQGRYLDLNFGYVDEKNQVCALSIRYDTQNPKNYYIGIMLNNNAAPEKRQITLLTSIKLNKVKDAKQINNKKAKSLLLAQTGSPVISHLLNLVLKNKKSLAQTIRAASQIPRHNNPASEDFLQYVIESLEKLLQSKLLAKLTQLSIFPSEQAIRLLMDKKSQLSKWISLCDTDEKIKAVMELHKNNKPKLINLVFKYDYMPKLVNIMTGNDELLKHIDLLHEHHFAFKQLVKSDSSNITHYENLIHNRLNHKDMTKLLKKLGLEEYVNSFEESPEDIVNSKALQNYASLQLPLSLQTAKLLLNKESQLSKAYDNCRDNEQAKALLRLHQTSHHLFIDAIFKYDFFSFVVNQLSTNELNQLAHLDKMVVLLLEKNINRVEVFKKVASNKNGYARLIDAFSRLSLEQHIDTLLNPSNNKLRRLVLEIEKQCDNTAARIAKDANKSKLYETHQKQYKQNIYSALCMYFSSEDDSTKEQELEQAISKATEPFIENALKVDRAPVARKLACFVINLISHVLGVGMVFNAYHKYKTGNWLLYSEPKSVEEFNSLGSHIKNVAPWLKAPWL